MGGFLLFLILVMLFFTTYYYFSGLISPSVQLIGMFLVGCFCYIMFSQTWEADLSFNTIFVVSSTLIMFSLGEAVSKRTKIIDISFGKRNRYVCIDCDTIRNNIFIIKNCYFIVLTILSAVILYFYYKYTMKLSAAAGNIYGFSRMINFAYNAKNNLSDMPDEPSYVTLGLVISRCFAYYCIFITTFNAIVKHRKLGNLKYFIPIMLYLAQALLASGRTQLLRFCIHYLITFMVLQENISIRKKIQAKTFFKIIAVAVLFLAAYRAYGIWRGSLHTDMVEILSYPAAPLQALNLYLDNPKYSDVFGGETLVTIRSILRKIGIDSPNLPLSLSAIRWSNGSTNIYTAIRRYIADYYIVGMFIIVFILGFFYGYLKKWMLQNGQLVSLIIYAMLIYPVIEFLFEERFFIGVLSAGTLYYLICVLLMKRIIRLIPR